MERGSARAPGIAQRLTRSAAGRARLAGCFLALAIAVAPFCAVLYGWNAGLATMALALVATAYVTHQTAGSAAPPLRVRLRFAAAINALLALGCAIALVLRR